MHEYCATALHTVDPAMDGIQISRQICSFIHVAMLPLRSATEAWGNVCGSPQAMGLHCGVWPVHAPLALHIRVAFPETSRV